jgi:glycosyltransferase involved in cell wall biosynthesis
MKKKILFLLHIPPPIHGSSIIGSIIRESEIINSSFNCKYINLSTSSNANKIGEINLKKFFLYFKIIFQIIRFNIRYRFDIVYIAPAVSDLGFFKDFFLVFIIKMLNKRVVFHLHNKGVSQNDSLIHKIFYKYFFKNIKVILLSELLFQDIIKFVDKKDVYICPNGIEVLPLLENELNDRRNNSIPNILFLSNLISTKGVIDLIEACAILKKKGIIFKLKIIGSEVDVSEITLNKLKIKYDLINEMEYLGVKIKNEKHTQLLMSDIFVFPTYYDKECFPLVILEAMQYGLPIISTIEGGIPDLVNDGINGIIVNKRSPYELSVKIESLLSDKRKMKRFGEESRSIFLKMYTKEVFELRFKDILSMI